MIDFIVEELKDKQKDIAENYKKMVSTKYCTLGYKTAVLKACAKKLATQKSCNDMIGLVPDSYEELVVLGLIMGYAKGDITQKFDAINYFISINDNWSAIDSVVHTFKSKDEKYFKFLLDLLNKDCWSLRFSLTALADNFLDEKHLVPIFERLFAISYANHYINKTIARFLAVAYERFSDITQDFYEMAALNEDILKITVSKVGKRKYLSQDLKIRLEETMKDVLCKREMC